MKEAIVTLESVTPYSQSKPHRTEKLPKELSDAYEKRTWRERLYANREGNVYIPASQFKMCLAEIAKYLGIQIPGKGKSNYTKHFLAGILVPHDLVLPIKKDEIESEEVLCDAQGGRGGGGSKVWKTFGIVSYWKGEMTFVITDDIITEEIFRHHLEQAGILIGIGRARPTKKGPGYGRFKVLNLLWSE